MIASHSIYLTLGHQLGLLTSIIVGLGLVRRFAGSDFRLVHQLVAGAVVGGGAVVSMLDPIELAPGIIFDARTPIIAISAPFLGPWTTVVATLLTACYRWSLGGSGLGPALCSLTATGLVSISFAAALRRRQREARARDLPFLAALASLVNVCTFLLLPSEVVPRVFQSLALPLIITNFVGIGVLGMILIEMRRRRQLQRSLATALQERSEQAQRLAAQAAALQNQADLLRTSEAQYRVLADNTVDMIVRADPSAHRLYVSPGSRWVVGHEPEELVGTNPRDFVHPEDAAGLIAKLEALGRGDADQASNIHRFRHKDGHWVWVEVKFRLIRSEAGLPLEVVSIVRDISDRMRLEEQLRQAQRMQTLGQLTGGIAHDFNNLLVVVLGNAEALAEELSHPNHKDLAEQILVAAERASDLTQKLLSFGRRQSLQVKLLDLPTVVQELKPLLHRALSANVELVVNPERSALARVDRSLMESAILNLVVNARDAMPGGGRLVITTGQRLAAAGEEGFIPGEPVTFVTVTDTGSGIEPDVLTHVFEPFFTTKAVGKGSGLGLAMVYGFAKQSGGHVAIESQVGRGTSVSIILRAAEAPAATPLREEDGRAPSIRTAQLLTDPMANASESNALKPPQSGSSPEMANRPLLLEAAYTAAA